MLNIHLVDDEESIRDSLSLLLSTAGFTVFCYENAKRFLERYQSHGNDCLLLDLRMPGLSGLELQQRLMARDVYIPIIFVTAHGDIPQCKQAFINGATDFLSKPIKAEELFTALNKVAHWHDEQAKDPRALLLHSLTPKEHEVMRMLLDGHANKDIAEVLSLNIRTLETHRGNIYRKLHVNSLTELIGRYLPVAIST